VTSVGKQQRQRLGALKEVLNISSYRIANQVRIEAFKELEGHNIDNYIRKEWEKELDYLRDLHEGGGQVGRYSSTQH
jgi:hypothetical protein